MSRKNFEVPDHGLWDEVKRAIQPIKARNAPRKKAKLVAVVQQRIALQSPAPNLPALRNQNKQPPPALSSFDRRTAQRLGRGSIEPMARLDLHGENVETARVELLNFILRQRRQGVRLVLVITGKGASPFARHTLHGHSHFHAPEREGKLRREVPLWFQDKVFRTHVVGFQPAHPRHGGGGAYYVKLRKPTDDIE